jgi:hypothetical protein
MLRQIISSCLLILGTGLLFGQSSNSISSEMRIVPMERATDQMLPFQGEGEIRDGLPVYRFRVTLPRTVDPASVQLSLSGLSWVTDQDPFINVYPTEFGQADYRVVESARKNLWRLN